MTDIVEVRPSHQISTMPNGARVAFSAPYNPLPGLVTLSPVEQSYDGSWTVIGGMLAQMFGSLDPGNITQAMEDDSQFGANMFAALDATVASISPPAPTGWPILPPSLAKIDYVVSCYFWVPPDGANMPGNLAALAWAFGQVWGTPKATQSWYQSQADARDVMIDMASDQQVQASERILWPSLLGKSRTDLKSILHQWDAQAKAGLPM